jgi:membrane fusion protein, multidrug efflux system
MKKWMKWALAAVVALALAGAVFRAISARSEQQKAVAASAAAPKTPAGVELATTDLVKVASRELSQGMPISGSLKAVNSAFVKARAAGELQGLSVREGDAVKAGQIIARVDPIEYTARLQQTQRSAEAAKTQIDIAQRQYDNNKALVDQGFISKTALDTSSATLEGARASYASAQAAVAITKKAMDDTVLRAPIGGWISQRLVQPGERVGIDAKVVEIVDLSRMELEASLSAADAAGVRVGQIAQLQIEGIAEPIAATVARINPATTAGNRGVLVYLSVASRPGLRQGLFAQGSLGTSRAQVLAVPVTSVRTNKPAPYVQVIENNAVLHKPVELGLRGEFDGQMMVAIKGVAEGTTVLAATVGLVREGSAVKISPGAK